MTLPNQLKVHESLKLERRTADLSFNAYKALKAHKCNGTALSFHTTKLTNADFLFYHFSFFYQFKSCFMFHTQPNIKKKDLLCQIDDFDYDFIIFQLNLTV